MSIWATMRVIKVPVRGEDGTLDYGADQDEHDVEVACSAMSTAIRLSFGPCGVNTEAALDGSLYLSPDEARALASDLIRAADAKGKR